MPWAIAGGAVLGGLISAKGSKDAASTMSGSADKAAQLQWEQFLQSRQDYAPYREVAVGQEIYGNEEAYRTAVDTWNNQKDNLQYLLDAGKIDQATYDKGITSLGDIPQMEEFGDFQEVTGYTGGALNTLADYGRSQVDPSDYIPESNIPEYLRSEIGLMPEVQGDLPAFNVSGDIPQFNVSGDIPEFDSTQFDIYKDPSYDWRFEEGMRGVDRAMAGMGKLTSGNRLNELMERGQDMASQEYGAAYGRMLTDYDIQRANEASKYGRDVQGYGFDRENEASQYGRDMGEYGVNLQNALYEYGFDVDDYGRVYQRDVDQYGRDLTAYNADLAREDALYDRGFQEYGLDYGQESDYLNRLAALSNIGQTATSDTAKYGAYGASGAADSITAAGAANAAGTIGQTNAWTNLISDLSGVAGDYLQSNPSSGNAWDDYGVTQADYERYY